MATSPQFKITVNLEEYRAYLAKKKIQNGEMVDLSKAGCLTIPDNGKFDVLSTDGSVQVWVHMNVDNVKNNGTLDQVLPLFYFPQVGSFSYRSGNWFITDLTFKGFEGKTPGTMSYFGQDINVEYSIQQGLTSKQAVDFRIHFEINFHDIDADGNNNGLKSNPCFIDPRLQVGQPKG